MTDWKSDPTQLREYAARCREKAKRERDYAELCLASKDRANHIADAQRYDRWAAQAEAELEALKL